jgi:hypothetical protein
MADTCTPEQHLDTRPVDSRPVDTCVVCHHRDPTYGRVCTTCRDRIGDGLTELLRKMAALRLHLVPAARPATGRVGGRHVGAPLPARLDVLSLAGPGNIAVTAMLHPLVRRWSATRTVTVTYRVGGKTVSEDRDVTDWHQETIVGDDGTPVLVPSDDQSGTVPPAEWLDSWAGLWRRHFGHHTRPPRPARRGPSPVDGGNPNVVDVVAAVAHPVTRRAVAVIATVANAYRRHVLRTVLSLTDGHGGLLPVDQRPDDPVTDELIMRFGDPGADAVSATNVQYLLTWLDRACAADVGIADLANELRAVNAELTRVLGETPDQQWLGRCPAQVTHRRRTNPDDEVTRPCGAGLWQDPHASQVRCPRCHATWGPRTVELLYLAAQIRRVHPVDRRRRYTTGEAAALPTLRCPGCATAVRITWRDVTATGDQGQWWRPEKAVCPALGCSEAARLI